MIRRPPRSTPSASSAASDVYKRQHQQPLFCLSWGSWSLCNVSGHFVHWGKKPYNLVLEFDIKSRGHFSTKSKTLSIILNSSTHKTKYVLKRRLPLQFICALFELRRHAIMIDLYCFSWLFLLILNDFPHFVFAVYIPVLFYFIFVSILFIYLFCFVNFIKM